VRHVATGRGADGRRAAGPSRAERGRGPRGRAALPRRHRGVGQAVALAGRWLPAAHRARQYAAAVPPRLPLGLRAARVRVHVRAELQHLLRRDALHRLVLRPVPEFRQHQRRASRSPSGHGRPEPVPVDAVPNAARPK